jgi:hypothetical protein
MFGGKLFLKKITKLLHTLLAHKKFDPLNLSFFQFVDGKIEKIFIQHVLLQENCIQKCFYIIIEQNWSKTFSVSFSYPKFGNNLVCLATLDDGTPW